MSSVLLLGKSGWVPKTLGAHLNMMGLEVCYTTRDSENLTKGFDLLVPEGKPHPELFLDFFNSKNISTVINTSNYFSRSNDWMALKMSLESNLTFPSAVLVAAHQSSVHSFINLASAWQLDPGRLADFPNYVGIKKSFSDFASNLSPNLKFWNVYVHELFGAGDPRPKLLNLMKSSLESGSDFVIRNSSAELHLTEVSRLARHIGNIILGSIKPPENHSYVNFPSVKISQLIDYAETGSGKSIRWIDKMEKLDETQLIGAVEGELLSREAEETFIRFFKGVNSDTEPLEW